LPCDKGSLTYTSLRWWPDAPIDRHLSIIYYTLWLFVWDDHFDSRDIDPSLPTAGDQLSHIHAQAIEYIKYHLGLSKLEYEPMAPSQYSKIFAEAGEFFRSGMTETQRTRFLKQINFYMECSHTHQRYIEHAKIPKTRDEYWRMRSGDSAYLTYCALNEYGNICRREFININGFQIYFGYICA
jgi:hypothetical protein